MFTQDVQERYAASTLITLVVAALTVTPLLFLPMQGALRLVTIAGSVTFFVLLYVFTRPFRTVHIELNDRALSIGFGTMFREQVPLPEIVSCEPYRYRPLADWGGWGYRLSSAGVMFNVFGDGGRAVRIKRRNGSALHFSSSDPEAVCRAIDAARASC